jgi:hypothetical protein
MDLEQKSSLWEKYAPSPVGWIVWNRVKDMYFGPFDSFEDAKSWVERTQEDLEEWRFIQPLPPESAG